MATQKELLYKVLEQTSENNRNIGDLSKQMRDLKKDQGKMNAKISEMNLLIVHPEDGLIVSTNKNTEWRKMLSDEFKLYQEERQAQARLLDDFSRWKNIADKAIWIIFTAVVALIVKIIVLG